MICNLGDPMSLRHPVAGLDPSTRGRSPAVFSASIYYVKKNQFLNCQNVWHISFNCDMIRNLWHDFHRSHSVPVQYFQIYTYLNEICHTYDSYVESRLNIWSDFSLTLYIFVFLKHFSLNLVKIVLQSYHMTQYRTQFWCDPPRIVSYHCHKYPEGPTMGWLRLVGSFTL